MNIKDVKNDFNGKFLELRKIINFYALISNAPSDEFDSLNYKVLNHLYNGTDFEKIKRVLESELITYYGFFADEIEVDKMAYEITEWWQMVYKI